MLSYLFKRLLLALPTLLIVSWIAFGLSKCAPGDPVERIFGEDLSSSIDPERQARAYAHKARQLGLDKPIFYISIRSHALPDTLYRIFPPERRDRLLRLARHTGQWPVVAAYEQQQAAAIRTAEALPDSLPAKAALRLAASNLQLAATPAAATEAVAELGAAWPANMARPPEQAGLDQASQRMVQAAQRRSLALPAFQWYGFDNQYHHWLKGFVTGNLGLSVYTRQPIWPMLRPRIMATLLLSGVALVLALLIAVPLGVAMAARHESRFDRWGRRLLLVVYALPVFWMGSLLMLLLATPGVGLALIPGIALSPYTAGEQSFVQWCIANSVKFILPVATMSLHLIAIFALQMRSGMLDTLQADFVRTARAKGLRESAVLWRHAFRNALFPLIALFTGALPTLLGGSVVVESLFLFPGMGLKTQEAFLERDYPVLFAIVMLSAVLTILANILADVLYAWADPRVRMGRR
jgi:peptide/nickel transport system permease protein